MKDFDLRKYLAEGKLLKENEEPTGFLFRFSKEDAMNKAMEVLDQKDISYNELGVHLVFHDKFGPATEEEVSEILRGEDRLEWVIGEWKGDIYLKSEEEIKGIANLAENKLLKEDMSLTMDELEKLANLKSDEFKSSPKKLVDMVMGSVKFNLEKDGTNIENASEDEIDKLRYKWARLKGLLKVKDTFTSMYGKRGVKTNTDKDLLDKIKAEGKLVKENIQDEDLIASQAIDILDEFRVYAESEDLIQYLNQSMDYLERIPSNDDVYSAIQAVADGLNPYTGEEFDYEVDDMQSELERLIA